MTATDLTAISVEVMWRPGCPYCSSLRRGLRRAGVVTTEHDMVVGVGGLVAAAGLTGVLYGAGWLQGPILTGVGTAVEDQDQLV